MRAAGCERKEDRVAFFWFWALRSDEFQVFVNYWMTSASTCLFSIYIPRHRITNVLGIIYYRKIDFWRTINKKLCWWRMDSFRFFKHLASEPCLQSHKLLCIGEAYLLHVFWKNITPLMRRTTTPRSRDGYLSTMMHSVFKSDNTRQRLHIGCATCDTSTQDRKNEVYVRLRI